MRRRRDCAGCDVAQCLFALYVSEAPPPNQSNIHEKLSVRVYFLFSFGAGRAAFVPIN